MLKYSICYWRFTASCTPWQVNYFLQPYLQVAIKMTALYKYILTAVILAVNTTVALKQTLYESPHILNS